MALSLFALVTERKMKQKIAHARLLHFRFFDTFTHCRLPNLLSIFAISIDTWSMHWLVKPRWWTILLEALNVGIIVRIELCPTVGRICHYMKTFSHVTHSVFNISFFPYICWGRKNVSIWFRWAFSTIISSLCRSSLLSIIRFFPHFSIKSLLCVCFWCLLNRLDFFSLSRSQNFSSLNVMFDDVFSRISFRVSLHIAVKKGTCIWISGRGSDQWVINGEASEWKFRWVK